MSRWIENYQNHKFRQVWSDLLARLKETTVTDETVVTSVQELARLKKVINFLNGAINSLDPELIPLGTWDQFLQQATPCGQHIANFNNNKNIGHIQNANAHADNLLTYIRPYMLTNTRAVKLLAESVKEQIKTIGEYVAAFQSESKISLEEIKNSESESDELRTKIVEIHKSAKELEEKLLGTDEEKSEGIEKKLNDLASLAEQKFDEINNFYNETLIDESKKPSTKTEIEYAKETIITSKSEIEDLLESVSKQVKDLESFHVRIYGTKTSDNEVTDGVLKDLEERIAALSAFESKQKEKYNALNKQIETLLPGATSAGLATAYKSMKDSFDIPIKNASRTFFLSIGILVIASLILSVDSIGSSEPWITFVKLDTWDAVLKELLHKLPFYAPVLWLAFYATKRRSESQRLQQEYAHKEALAKSYDNYKKQIEALDASDKEMQKAFIMKAIDAIAYNASQTLDGKHGDDHPAKGALDKLLDVANEIQGALTRRKPE